MANEATCALHETGANRSNLKKYDDCTQMIAPNWLYFIRCKNFRLAMPRTSTQGVGFLQPDQTYDAFAQLVVFLRHAVEAVG